jgi:hypothetical protein
MSGTRKPRGSRCDDQVEESHAIANVLRDAVLLHALFGRLICELIRIAVQVREIGSVAEQTNSDVSFASVGWHPDECFRRHIV